MSTMQKKTGQIIHISLLCVDPQTLSTSNNHFHMFEAILTWWQTPNQPDDPKTTLLLTNESAVFCNFTKFHYLRKKLTLVRMPSIERLRYNLLRKWRVSFKHLDDIWISHNPTRSGENFTLGVSLTHDIILIKIEYIFTNWCKTMTWSWLGHIFTAAWEQLVAGFSGASKYKYYTLKYNMVRNWLTAA